MNPFNKFGMKSATVLASALFSAAGPEQAASASPAASRSTSASDDQSLARGSIEDVTPQQKYRSAIREAGGAYKESLRDCAGIAGAARQECIREAKATYDRDMAEAMRILRS